MLAQPASALTDLLLGAVVVTLAFRLGRVPTAHRHWRRSLWWAGIAALCGFVHHGFVVRSEQWAEPSWAVISAMIVVAVSYLLAATVVEVLGPRHRTAFWLLRSLGIVAYAALALTGNAGITSLLLCESLTMISILALWGWAASRRHPMAGPVILAIAASGAAAGVRSVDPDITERVWLDPVSAYHLAQIVGMVLLYQAVSAPRPPDSEGAGGWVRPGGVSPAG